jgi:hypothetical protein
MWLISFNHKGLPVGDRHMQKFEPEASCQKKRRLAPKRTTQELPVIG